MRTLAGLPGHPRQNSRNHHEVPVHRVTHPSIVGSSCGPDKFCLPGPPPPAGVLAAAHSGFPPCNTPGLRRATSPPTTPPAGAKDLVDARLLALCTTISSRNAPVFSLDRRISNWLRALLHLHAIAHPWGPPEQGSTSTRSNCVQSILPSKPFTCRTATSSCTQTTSQCVTPSHTSGLVPLLSERSSQSFYTTLWSDRCSFILCISPRR